MTPAPRYAEKSERDTVQVCHSYQMGPEGWNNPSHCYPCDGCTLSEMRTAADYLDARLAEAQSEKPLGNCADCGKPVYGCDGFLNDGKGWHHPACEMQTALQEAQAREAAQARRALLAEHEIACQTCGQTDERGPCGFEPQFAVSDAARELLEKARRWDNFNEAFDRVPEEAERLYADLTKAKAERDAYREDAERYRALMQTAEKIWKVGGDREVCVVPGFDSTKLWVLSRQEYEKDREDAEKWRESKQLVDADMAKRLDALQRENAALREVAEAAKHVANDPEWRRLVRTGDMSNLQRTLAQLRDDAPEGER